MADLPPPKPFNLAVIGGGIAGVTIAIALHKYRIPFTLYESAAAFGEIGAGVGFQPNMVRVMELISPAIKEGFMRCKTDMDTDPPIWFNVRVGDSRKGDSEDVVSRKDGKIIKVGEKLFDIHARPGPRSGVHRAHFLDELVKLLPADVAQFRKRLAHVTEAEDGSGDAVLHFADGTTAQHTAVIGCDGIKSRTRELVLGKLEAQPAFSGKYAYRGLIPMAKAQEIMGKEAPMSPQMFVGHGGHVLTFPIAHGTIMNVVAFISRKTWTDPEWVVQTSREDMLADYASWCPVIQSIMANMVKPTIWALFNHPSARTYVQTRPRICLLGDAAHASTPHSGSGAGMCIEDAYILSELLAEAKTVEDLGRAFHAYDQVRRPRTLKLVKESREAGRLYGFESPTGDDLDALKENMSTRMSWIWDFDARVDLERARVLYSTVS